MWQRLSFDQSKAHRMYEKHCSFWNINHCPAARCFFASHFCFFLHPAFSRFAPLCEPCQSKHHNIYSVYPVAESVFFSAYQMLSSDFTKEFVTHSFGRWLDPVKLSSVNKKKYNNNNNNKAEDADMMNVLLSLEMQLFWVTVYCWRMKNDKKIKWVVSD